MLHHNFFEIPTSGNLWHFLSLYESECNEVSPLTTFTTFHRLKQTPHRNSKSTIPHNDVLYPKTRLSPGCLVSGCFVSENSKFGFAVPGCRVTLLPHCRLWPWALLALSLESCHTGGILLYPPRVACIPLIWRVACIPPCIFPCISFLCITPGASYYILPV